MKKRSPFYARLSLPPPCFDFDFDLRVAAEAAAGPHRIMRQGMMQ
jgi:hypothetical protein